MQNSLFPLVLVSVVNCEQWLGYIKTAYIVFPLKDLKPKAALMKRMCQWVEKVLIFFFVFFVSRVSKLLRHWLIAWTVRGRWGGTGENRDMTVILFSLGNKRKRTASLLKKWHNGIALKYSEWTWYSHPWEQKLWCCRNQGVSTNWLNEIFCRRESGEWNQISNTAGSDFSELLSALSLYQSHRITSSIW